MRILLLAGSYPPETGGIARFMQAFVNGLMKRGVEVEVISQIEMRERGYLNRVWSCRNMVIDRASRKSFDRVVASSWSPFAVALPARVAGRSLPFDVFCHGMDLLEPARSGQYRYLMRRTLRKAGRILANSKYTANLALEAGAPKQRITIVHPAVDSNRFVPRPKAAAPPILLSVGRIVERKGFDMVIRALPEVLRKFPDLKYVCVGEGPEIARLRLLADSKGVSTSVNWVSGLNDDQLLSHYQSADVFAMPSRLVTRGGSVEGFGIVFLEASACEVPVIGGNSGGIPDAIIEGATGYIVDPGNVEQLASRIIELLSDPGLRQRMGRAGRQRVVQEFSEDKIAECYLGEIEGKGEWTTTL
jgi:phosphatidylinositol alpha-1,6-mannosyltransferase